MRARITPMIVTTSDRLEYSDCVNEYRRDLMTAMAGKRGLDAYWLEGQWQGKPEKSLIVLTPYETAKELALDLAKHFDQEYLCVVNADSSVYQHDVATGDEKFKGSWKSVPGWRMTSFLKSGGDFTFDPNTGIYYTVGS